MKYLFTLRFLIISLFPCASFFAFGEKDKNPVEIWRSLLKEQSDSVTWVSVTVRIEVSAGGRSFPPSERKLEALGTVLAEDGLTVLSLNEVDPSDSILSRMRSPGDINVNYTEVLILRPDGSEIEDDFLLKDEDLDLAFIKPKNVDPAIEQTNLFKKVPYQEWEVPRIRTLDEVVSLGKLGRNLYRKSTLQRGWVNAVISKPRDYYVVENVTHGNKAYSNLNEGYGKVLRYGAYSAEVLRKLRWMNEVMGPILAEALAISDGSQTTAWTITHFWSRGCGAASARSRWLADAVMRAARTYLWSSSL